MNPKTIREIEVVILVIGIAFLLGLLVGMLLELSLIL